MIALDRQILYFSLHAVNFLFFIHNYHLLEKHPLLFFSKMLSFLFHNISILTNDSAEQPNLKFQILNQE